MVVVSGIGWISSGAFGAAFRGLQGTYSHRKDLVQQMTDHQVFHPPLPPLGRYDAISRITCYAVGLCLLDGRTAGNSGLSGDVGIMGANDSACVDSNIDYFQDFVSSGRTLGRGNLFIYTLPSSAIEAASIYFGLEGPVFYLSFSQDRTQELLHSAAHMVETGDADSFVAVDASATRGMAFLLSRDSQTRDQETRPSLQNLKLLLKSNPIDDSFDAFLQGLTKTP